MREILERLSMIWLRWWKCCTVREQQGFKENVIINEKVMVAMKARLHLHLLLHLHLHLHPHLLLHLLLHLLHLIDLLLHLWKDMLSLLWLSLMSSLNHICTVGKWMLESWIIGFVQLNSIAGLKRLMMISQISNMILFTWKVHLSSGGRLELKKILRAVVKLSLGMIL